jgi:peptide chain release factor 1
MSQHNDRELLWSITKSDLKIDTFRCGGKGGQNQNKRDTGVRITHIDSGISAECREHRTQDANKKAAFEKLAKMLVEHFNPQLETDRYLAGKHVVRTYHEPNNRVTDHDAGVKASYKHTVGKGDMSELIQERARLMALKQMSES